MITLPEPWPANPWPTRFRTVRTSPPDALPDGLRFVTVQSPALGGRADMAVFVPDGIAPDAVDVPLVLLLHGVYGSFWNWTLNGRAPEILSALLEDGHVGPMVLAMPSDGLTGEGTAYLDHGTSDYESWVIDDVPACVAEAVGAVTERSPLMLGGNSMGGFGALRLGIRHAGRVTAIAAHSPITDLADLAAFTVDDLGAKLGLDAAECSLAAMIERHDDALPPILFDCGRRDPLLETNRRLHEALDLADIRHRYDEYDGAHDWSSWQRRLAVALPFFDRAARSARTVESRC